MTPIRFVSIIGSLIVFGGIIWFGLRITDTGRTVRALDFSTCERLGGLIQGEINQVCEYGGESFEEPLERKNIERLVQLQLPERTAISKSPLVVSGIARREFISANRIQIELYDSAKELIATGTGRFGQSTSSPLSDWNDFRTRLFFETRTATGTLVVFGAAVENFPTRVEYPVRFTPLRTLQTKLSSGMCVRAGCGGELCIRAEAAPQPTQCSASVENKCLAHATCGMQENGQCGWSKTPESSQCQSTD